MNFKHLMATTAAVITLGVSAASAASFSFVGTNQTQVIAKNDLGLGLNGQTIDFISGDQKSTSNGLSIVGGPAKITFTYLGFEAGNTNFSANVGGTIFTNKGPGASAQNASVSVNQLLDGLVAFSFGTTAPVGSQGEIFNNAGANPASSDYAIGYKAISATSYYVLFDDIASGDRDFDDIGMRIDIAPVPLPAAGFMLLAGIGGLAAMKRRKKAS
ncbi:MULTISPECIES: VPLPA-CTERM sorting domain-containing protein [Roseobacter]|uniref:VPLPA-CTERM protein sorting domain-containing protein n=1 Tax=Roseobacter litoralis (strain ATCC 49566 / DSM 6996 / JCM 21268 / NBRC 15278 / OCh 149) TaxID=391595 RepID=F7ZDZ1_ROSLO|nr:MULTISPECIES: VPLPA-CTERM sorting domain-containing protein [Roseobacter]AEI92110.1 hypothetical protein RLO149_c000780 [Roseobacter litoralis Och 149]GIT87409.1 hypothetical protein ROBYS_24250 [Roseobacter sp. OBYS 0001]